REGAAGEGMTGLYARIIASLLAKGRSEDEVVSSLTRHLQEKGRMKLLPGILRELKALSARRANAGATLEVARKEDEAPARAYLAAEGIEAGEAVVNPALLRGWRVRTAGTLIDRSGKRAL